MIDLKKLLILADYTILTMCILFFVGMAAYAWNVSQEMVGFVSGVVGWIGKCIADAHGFEFASSRGSQDKDKTIAALAGNGKEHP